MSWYLRPSVITPDTILVIHTCNEDSGGTGENLGIVREKKLQCWTCKELAPETVVTMALLGGAAHMKGLSLSKAREVRE